MKTRISNQLIQLYSKSKQEIIISQKELNEGLDSNNPHILFLLKALYRKIGIDIDKIDKIGKKVLKEKLELINKNNIGARSNY